MSIANIGDKIKGMEESTVERVFVITLIILVGIGSFGLGRLSATSSKKSAIRIENGSIPTDVSQKAGSAGVSATVSPEVKGATTAGERTSASVFASKNGSLYYTSSCQSGSRVSEKNKIWFDSPADAEKFGLKPGCK